jgi:hypothetical protein
MNRYRKNSFEIICIYDCVILIDEFTWISTMIINRINKKSTVVVTVLFVTDAWINIKVDLIQKSNDTLIHYIYIQYKEANIIFSS